MIIFHHNHIEVTQLTNEAGEDLPLPEKSTLSAQFFQIAATYPDETIIWLGSTLEAAFPEIKKQLIEQFLSKNMMVSIGNIDDHFLYPDIGYVSDGPFTAVSSKCVYPTWLMQDSAGIVNAATVNQFDQSSYKKQSLEFTLSSIAKIGQAQGLLCYHIPFEAAQAAITVASRSELFTFVAQHYKRFWSWLLLVLKFKYDGKFSFFAFAKAQLNPLSPTSFKVAFPHQNASAPQALDYDVVIPTMGRSSYLKDVLNDLSQQHLLPRKVIIVEQNEDPGSTTALDYIANDTWPYEIEHLFIHKTGACNARNLALDKVTAEWVLLFDDDVRVAADFMNGVAQAIRATDGFAFTFACLQEGDREDRKGYVQWENFGSGCSIVHKDIASKLRFDTALEHGYGEDTDYGMQIRNAGYDVIYVPEVQMKHLKAPIGGFRSLPKFRWSNDEILPKPSPHIMYHRKKNFTLQQLRGYKWVLFFKYYKRQSIKNPISYLKKFKTAWKNSEFWASKLASND